ncbi:MAG: hypothetical protein Q7U73_06300 [Rubrivivax sp.]|nr:hypothetical protein [Rubrivivax sp.]
MRSPTAVAVRCTGGWPWRLLNVVLPTLAAGVAAAWALLHFEAPVAPAAAVAAAVLLLSWRLSRPRERLLQWDGQRWTADGLPGRLQLMFDLGPFMLLRLHPADAASGRVPWLAVTAAEAGAAWHALRAAVYSRPPETPAGAARPERAAD